MRLSKMLFNTWRESPADADIVSAKLMLRAGFIRKVASGIYEWLPLGLRSLKKVENIIRQEMDAIGGQEVWLPHLQPKELWDETGRWDLYGKELVRLTDRKGTEYCLGPTAEEVITALVRDEVKSYRQLPMMLYQFGTKFRDEIRPRFGVMRAREFYMKDAYSFHTDESDAEKYYQTVFEAYSRIFTRCGLKFRAVEAGTGNIGGSFSHEFMALADTGEEEIASCNKCGYAASVELIKGGAGACPKCHEGSLGISRGIEVGHTFELGTKYSGSMGAAYLDGNGQSKSIVMGCYGIGVSRIVAAAIEQNHDEGGIIWTPALAPYEVIIIPTNIEDSAIADLAQKAYDTLRGSGVEVLLDDRDQRAGVKFKDADLAGCPVRITAGKKASQGIVEIKLRHNGQMQETDIASLTEVFQSIRHSLASTP